jgi:hypothetical protein
MMVAHLRVLAVVAVLTKNKGGEQSPSLPRKYCFVDPSNRRVCRKNTAVAEADDDRVRRHYRLIPGIPDVGRLSRRRNDALHDSASLHASEGEGCVSAAIGSNSSRRRAGRAKDAEIVERRSATNSHR